MSIINLDKPSTSIANSSKVFDYETWASIQTTWTTETRTWAETISTMDNERRPNTTLWDDKFWAWDSGVGWSSLETITNISKPI
jgi:hypothetical protein